MIRILRPVLLCFVALTSTAWYAAGSNITTGTLSTNAILASITTTPKATLTTATGPGYRNYTAAVANTVSSMQVTPIAQDATATIKVNGQAVASGISSQAIPLSFGANTITIVVTAQDGVTVKNYIVTVTRPASANAILTAITTTPKVILTAAAGPGYRNYTATVANSVNSIQVTPTAQDATATIKVNGQAVNSGALSQPIPLGVGPNTITIAVTAQDGTTTKSYIITATRAASAVATLSNMVLNAGVLSPAFASATTDYSARVPNATASIRVTPTVTASGASVKVNGHATASGAGSTAIPLNVGANTITTVVTAPDGTTTKTYTVVVTRAAANLSTDATLYVLKLLYPNITLEKATTGAGYRNYTATVTADVYWTDVFFTTNNSNASVKIKHDLTATYDYQPVIGLKAGTNIITVEVTAEDGATIKNYVIYIMRPPMLSALDVSGGVFSQPYFSFINAAYSMSSIILRPATADGSSIRINGVPVVSGSAAAPVALAIGENTINILLTSPDGTIAQNYTVSVSRADASKSTNAVLTSIVFVPKTTLTPTTGPGYRNYTALLPYDVSSIKIIPTAEDATARISIINNNPVISGTESESIPVYPGTVNVYVDVVAEDQATTKKYIIKVTRAQSTYANLLYLELFQGQDPITLGPEFSPKTYTYSATVPNATSSVVIEAGADNRADNVHVNGVAIGWNEPQTINLVQGNNTVQIVVKTEDGAVSKTYTLNITRTPATTAAPGLAMKYQEPIASPAVQTVAVRQSLSPNGDGKSDALVIDGIGNYPDNKLQIMNRSGALVYQVKGYDNLNKTFDGQSNINGKLQPAGTYYYLLEYKDGNETRRKTGFIVLKY